MFNKCKIGQIEKRMYKQEDETMENEPLRAGEEKKSYVGPLIRWLVFFFLFNNLFFSGSNGDLSHVSFSVQQLPLCPSDG